MLVKSNLNITFVEILITSINNNGMRKVLVVLFAISVLVSCDDNGQSEDYNNGFEINARVSGLDTDKVHLLKKVDGEWKSVDSVQAKSGEFVFKGYVHFPEMYLIMFGNNEMAVTPIFLDNSRIELSAIYDSLDNASIKGSKSQDEFKQYLNEISHFNDKNKDLTNQYNQAVANKDEQTMKQIEETYKELMKSRLNFIENYVVAHNKSVVAPYVLSQIALGLEADKLDSILNLFDASLSSSVYTKQIKKRVNVLKRVSVGKEAPDFILNDTTGQPVSLSSYRGKYLLIDFWASWCAPCRNANPSNVAIYNEFKSDDFEILGVSFDENREDWVKAIRQDKLAWKQVSDLKGWLSEAGKLYGVRSIPQTILLDKKGIIIAKNLRGDKLKEKIAEVLKKK